MRAERRTRKAHPTRPLEEIGEDELLLGISSLLDRVPGWLSVRSKTKVEEKKLV